MANTIVGTVVLSVLACILVATPYAESSLSCKQIKKGLVPCLDYLRETIPDLPAKCCPGVKSVHAAIKSGRDRRNACWCIQKMIVTGYKGVVPHLVGGLPDKCRVDFGFTIAFSVDCSKVE